MTAAIIIPGEFAFLSFWNAAAAEIFAATLNKKAGELSLYHATLVLNFATLSSLASLAVAPLCPIWREKGLVVPLQQRLRDQLEGHDLGPEHSPLFSTLPLQRPEFADELARGSDDENAASQGFESDGGSELEPVHAPEHAPQSKQGVTYQRIVLSVALLAQVALQWSYALLLFTSPFYAEKSCTATTVVVLFGMPLKASEVRLRLLLVRPKETDINFRSTSTISGFGFFGWSLTWASHSPGACSSSFPVRPHPTSGILDKCLGPLGSHSSFADLTPRVTFSVGQS